MYVHCVITSVIQKAKWKSKHLLYFIIDNLKAKQNYRHSLDCALALVWASF